MAIKWFTYSLLVIAIILLTESIINPPIKIVQKKDLPAVTFINSIMYDIDNTTITQIVNSKKAYHYINSDILHDATIITKSDKNNSTTTVSAKHILKKKDKVILKGDVTLTNENGFLLETQFLKYDIKKQIATNKHKFKLVKLNDTLTGNSLYFDGINDIIKAKSTNFIIKMEK